jgi:hypothetical protein
VANGNNVGAFLATMSPIVGNGNGQNQNGKGQNGGQRQNGNQKQNGRQGQQQSGRQNPVVQPARRVGTTFRRSGPGLSR